MRPTLFIVAKAPIMGRAKTRLAADIGPVHAKRIYRSLMAQVLRQTKDPRWDTILAVTPPHLLGRVPDWEGFAQIPQVEGSLSPRLAALFTRKGPTLTIGTDCPVMAGFGLWAQMDLCALSFLRACAGHMRRPYPMSKPARMAITLSLGRSPM